MTDESLERQIGRLEAGQKSVVSSITELKEDLRKHNESVTNKFDELRREMVPRGETRVKELEDDVDNLKIEQVRSATRVGTAATIFGAILAIIGERFLELFSRQ